MLLAIGCSAWGLTAGEGMHWVITVFFGQDMVLHRADNLTLPFGVIFHLAACSTSSMAGMNVGQ